MKTRIYSMMLVLVTFISMSQSAMAKKVVYLGHQYKGDVNKENVPQGKGEIDVAGILIKGMFNGSSVTDATFGKDWLTYNGDITFNESNSIILKSGGVLTRYYYRADELGRGEIYGSGGKMFVSANELAGKRRSITETLSKDIEIDNDKLSKDVLNCHIELEFKGVPVELDPPLIKRDIPIQLCKSTLSTGRSYDGGEIYMYYIPLNILQILELPEKGVTNYKDDKDRIWNYKPESGANGMTYQVTYPDGSCINNETNNNDIAKKIAEWRIYGNKKDPTHSYYWGNDDWRIVYPNGTKIEAGGRETHVYIPHNDESLHFIIYYADLNSLNVPDVISGKQRILKLRPENGAFRVGSLDCSRRPNEVEDKKFNKIITESFLPLFDIPDDKALYFKRGNENLADNFLGYYYKGKYTTYSEEKKEEENTLKADRNKFKAQYGFDPIDGSGNVFKIGRALATIDAWNKWLKSHGYTGPSFKLSIDQGTSKCFDLYISGKLKGFFWAKNNVITSITWY